MALVEFQNNTAPYLNAENLNNNFNYLEEKTQDIYSTEEVVIGKWINKKPVYKKTFTGNYQNDATLIGNIDTLVKYYGTAGIGGIERTIPYFELYNNNIFNATVNLQSNNVKTSFISNNQTTSSNINITLEYTKTTDEGDE